MIIEITAIPGSGKTYLSNMLVNYLRENLDNEAYNMITRDQILELRKPYQKNILYKTIEFLPYLGKDSINILLELAKKKKIRPLRYAINILINFSTINTIQKNDRRKCIFILDESILHLSTSFFKDTSDFKKAKMYFEKINSINNINFNEKNIIKVFIDSSVKENIERINQRKQGWPISMRHTSSFEKEAALNRFLSRYNILKEYAAQNFDNNIIINNNVFQDNYDNYFSKIKENILEYYA